jgi:hypothetical protein
MEQLAMNPRVLEQHAKHVSDFLGDYTTFTAAERRFLKRSVMFYGWLRFSLRFAFYTMPLRHPVMTGLLGNLARLESNEIEELLGGDSLPFALGSIFLKGGKMQIELSRANPVLNVLTQTTSPRQLLGILPPYYGMLASQAFLQDPYTGQQFRVLGESMPRRFLGVPAVERLRIAAEQGARLFFPYRVAEEYRYKGATQGADTLLIDPRPIKYRSAEAQAQEARQRRQYEAKTPLRIAGEELAPWWPHPAAETIRLSKYIEAQKRRERRALHPGPERPEVPWSTGGGGSAGTAPWKTTTSSAGKAPWK